MSRFKNYFKNTVYGFHKVMGSDGTEDCVYGSLFLMACDIQDPFHHKEYDYVAFIIDSMHRQICDAKKGEMKDFKFHHYSLMMHLILYNNIGYVSGDLIDQTSDEFGELPMQLWTRVWHKDFYYTSALVFFNLFSYVIMRMVDHTFLEHQIF